GPAARLHPQDRTEPGFTDLPLRSTGDAGLAQAELLAPAVQQQEGAAGAAPYDGPGNLSGLGCRTVRILSGLPFGVCLRQPLRDEDRRRANHRARPYKSAAAC